MFSLEGLPACHSNKALYCVPQPLDPTNRKGQGGSGTSGFREGQILCELWAVTYKPRDCFPAWLQENWKGECKKLSWQNTEYQDGSTTGDFPGSNYFSGLRNPGTEGTALWWVLAGKQEALCSRANSEHWEQRVVVEAGEGKPEQGSSCGHYTWVPWPQRSMRMLDPLETELQAVASVCWEPHSAPLQRQLALLSTEPSL